MQVRFALGWVALGSLLASVLGCSGDQLASKVAARNDANIKRVNNLYSGFRAQYMGRPPSDEASLKEHVRKNIGQKKLDMMQINRDNLDATFVSERDGKPFNIKWGVGGGGHDPVVFEREGVGGKKLVAFSDATVEELDAAEADALWEQKAVNKPIAIGRPEDGQPTEAAPSEAAK